MKYKAFINYRKSEAAAEANLLRKSLEQALGGDKVFMDSSTTEPGQQWPRIINAALSEMETLVVVMHPDWVDVKDEQKNRRIDDSTDWVRREIHYALKHGKNLIPVLVNQGKMPARSELPRSIKRLAECQYIELRNDYWDDDVKRLLRALGVGDGSGSRSRPAEVVPANRQKPSKKSKSAKTAVRQEFPPRVRSEVLEILASPTATGIKLALTKELDLPEESAAKSLAERWLKSGDVLDAIDVLRKVTGRLAESVTGGDRTSARSAAKHISDMLMWLVTAAVSEDAVRALYSDSAGFASLPVEQLASSEIVHAFVNQVMARLSKAMDESVSSERAIGIGTASFGFAEPGWEVGDVIDEVGRVLFREHHKKEAPKELTQSQRDFQSEVYSYEKRYLAIDQRKDPSNPLLQTSVAEKINQVFPGIPVLRFGIADTASSVLNVPEGKLLGRIFTLLKLLEKL